MVRQLQITSILSRTISAGILNNDKDIQFTEIQTRNPTFKPRSYFDFGSGVVTGLWAASNQWKDSNFEYLLVDSSRSMNDLAAFYSIVPLMVSFHYLVFILGLY